jgi:glucosamine kinase
VATAELLDVPLATLDRRMASPPGPRCEFQIPGQLAPVAAQVGSGAVDWLKAMPAFPDVSGVVVVDGGGTRSRAALVSAEGELLGYAEGGPTNGRSAGDEAAAHNVGATIGDAVAAAGADAASVTAVLVTSASVDTQAHADVLSGGVRTAVPGNATIAVVSDTLGCWAATAKMAPAVAVIAGTGSAVLAGSLEQGSRRFGGWDYVLGDEGSGFAIGRAALQETLRVSEGRSSATDLAAACRKRLGIADVDELFDAVYKPSFDKSKVAAFAADVFDLADQDDEDADRLITSAAADLAATVAAAFDQFDHLDTLGCFGGIWNADRYRKAFASTLGDRVPERPAIVHPGDVAMAGAYRIVLRHHPDGEAGAVEDRAVGRFSTALLAAKEAAVPKGADH